MTFLIMKFIYYLLSLTVSLFIVSNASEEVRLNYRGSSVCSYRYQELFQLPFSNFKLIGGPAHYFSANQNNPIPIYDNDFLGEFSIIHNGIVQCSASMMANRDHYELSVFDLDNSRSVKVSIDSIGSDEFTSELSTYEAVIDACEPGYPISGLESIKLFLPSNFSVLSYTLEPRGTAFFPKLDAPDTFSIESYDKCSAGLHYMTLLVVAGNASGFQRSCSVDLSVKVGAAVSVGSQNRARRSAQTNARLLDFDQLEGTVFQPVYVPGELDLSGNSFLYNVILFDDVIELDTATGFVKLKSGAGLDREIQSEHILKFNVRDQSTNILHPVEFRLEVLDRDDTGPQIINERDPLQGFVPKNPEPGFEIMELLISDPDEIPLLMSDRQWSISLVSGSENSFFELSRQTIIPTSEVETVKILYAPASTGNFNQPSYSISVKLEDKARNSEIYDINIIVGDPVLQVIPIPDVITIPEDLPVDTLVYRVQVETGSSSSSVNFAFSTSDSDAFTFSPYYGEIWTNRLFDLDVVPAINSEFPIQLIVSDNTGQEVSKSFTIVVQDRNDQAPVFNPRIYYATIEEDQPTNEAIIFNDGTIDSLRATDNDQTSPNNEIFYLLNSDVPFIVNQLDGKVYPNGVDYEATRNGQLDPFTVIARDKGVENVNEDTATVIITIINTNDEQPIFDAQQEDGTCLYEFSVSQTIPDNFQVGSVSAYDPDGNSISYQIVGTFPFKFESPNIGVIVRKGSSGLLTQPVFEFEITATDDGEAGESQTCDVRVVVESANTNVPRFENCPNGKAQLSVDEESSIGTVVGDLVATDDDFGQSGRVDYFVQSDDWFSIERIDTGVNGNAVGRLLVNSNNLDRESKGEHCVYVIARDGYDETTPSSNYQQSACEVCVELNDVADTAPVFFNEGQIKVVVAQSNTVENTFFQVVAYDLDIVQNTISYSIVAAGSQNSDFFGISSTDGNLYNTKSLSSLLAGESEKDIKLVISAEDQAGMSNTIEVLVTITSEGGSTVNPPEFIDEVNGEFVFNVNENEPINSFLQPEIRAEVSGDGAFCLFSLGVGNTPASNADREFFDYQQLDDANNAVNVRLLKSLDYESIQRFDFFLRCQDSKNPFLEAQTKIIVNVVNVNDFIPIFVDTSVIFSVYENAQVNDPVGTMQALDRDPDTELAYSLEALGNNANNWFVIDPTSAVIRVVSSNLVQGTWQGNAIVRDNTPSSDNSGEPNETKDRVTIEIYDVNDNKPEVQSQPVISEHSYTIEESTPIGFGIASFVAVDVDTDPLQKFTFSITPDSGYVPFSLTNQGLLKVAAQLDFDGDNAITEYNFNIQVFDNVQNSDPYSITVFIVNVDDEPPVFTSSNTFTVVEEDDSQVGQVVFTVTAINNDPVGGNSRIIYGLSGSSVDDAFRINPDNGEITLLRKLDREAPGEDQLLLLATATETPSNFTSVLELTVIVTDINDHAPYFEKDGLRGLVPENSIIGTAVLRVIAKDDDGSEEFGTIVSYERTNGNCENLFTVESSTGNIIVAAAIDREEPPVTGFPLDECTIEITATDGGGLSGSTTVTIAIQDEDDIMPEFVTETVTADIEERTELDTLVYGVYINDGDTPSKNRGSNKPRLDESNTDFPDFQYFSVNYDPQRNMVEILNREPLTFQSLLIDRGDSLRIRILMTQGEGDVLQDSVDCTFTLINWNNHQPVVSVVSPNTDSFPIELIEGPNFDSTKSIATLSVSPDQDDPESGSTTSFQWFILWNSDPRQRFVVEPDANNPNIAYVYQRQELDKEIATEQEFELQICARDIPQFAYMPSLSGCSKVPIKTTNIDDTCPVFRIYPMLSVGENVEVSQDIWTDTMTALDFDDENGETRASFSVVSMDQTVFSFSNNQLRKRAGVSLDRETKEFYPIVFEVCDEADHCCEQTVYVTVTDQNDQSQSDGGISTVHVYYLQTLGSLARQADLSSSVYVIDGDCCADDDKDYTMTSGNTDRFTVEDNGRLSIFAGLTQGSYDIEVRVEDSTDTVNTVVTSQYDVMAYEVTPEMANHMMTIKLVGITANQFVGEATRFGRTNYFSILRNSLKDLMGVEDVNQVIMFALKQSNDNFEVDYGWPYHKPELDIGLVVRTGTQDDSPLYSPIFVNAQISLNRVSLSQQLGIDLAAVNIELCDKNSLGDAQTAQTNCYTHRSVNFEGEITEASSPQTSIVALDLIVETATNQLYYETIAPQSIFELEDQVCVENPCKNGGNCFAEFGDLSTQTMRFTFRCECVPGFTGPLCEKMERSFNGAPNAPSYALFEPLVFYRTNQHLQFDFITDQPNGLLLYAGPMDELFAYTNIEAFNQNEDFVSVELRDGVLKFQGNAGCASLALEIGTNLNDGQRHHVDIFINEHNTTLRIDYCSNAIVDEQEFQSHITRENICQVTDFIPGCGNYITLPQPLQLGGAVNQFLDYQDLSLNYYNGVIMDVINNGYVYDLADPVMSQRSVSGDIKTESFCFSGDNAVCGGNSRCVASYTQFLYCDCEVGRYGQFCEFRNEMHYFSMNSFIYYDLDINSIGGSLQPPEFNELQITFRTTRENVVLMDVKNTLEFEYISLKLFNGIPRVEFDFGSKLEIITLSSLVLDARVDAGVWVADGNIHTLKLLRYNNYFLLQLDGGGPYKQVYSQRNLFSRFNLDFEKVSIGGWPVYDQNSGLYMVNSGFIGCILDARINRLALPIKVAGGYSYQPQIEAIISQNIEAGCEKDPCGARLEPCPLPRTRCLNWFDISFCTCPLGTFYDINNLLCLNINECEATDPGICLNGGSCADYDPLNTTGNSEGLLFQCSCIGTFRGITCADPSEIVSEASLSLSAAIIIILAIILILIPLCCVFMYCKCRRHQKKAKPFPSDLTDDTQGLGFGQYEGGGEGDQEFYNIYPLRKPTSDVLFTSEGPRVLLDDPAISVNDKQSLYAVNGRYNLGFVPENEEVTQYYRSSGGVQGQQPIPDVLGPRLEYADDAVRRRGADCLMVYHYEGEGSDAGTISTVNTSPQNPADWQQFYDLINHPHLGTSARMFNDGLSDRE